MDTYKHSLNTCWFIFKIYIPLLSHLQLEKLPSCDQHASTRNLALALEAYHTPQFYYKLYIELGAPSHQHLPHILPKAILQHMCLENE